MKQYSAEYRSQLVKEALETRNVAMVARKHGVSSPTLYGWVRRSRQPVKGAFEKSRMQSLEKELKNSKLENEILKELLKKTNLAWLGDSKSLETLLKTEATK